MKIKKPVLGLAKITSLSRRFVKFLCAYALSWKLIVELFLTDFCRSWPVLTFGFAETGNIWTCYSPLDIEISNMAVFWLLV